jgi:hypothetical protein
MTEKLKQLADDDIFDSNKRLCCLFNGWNYDAYQIIFYTYFDRFENDFNIEQYDEKLYAVFNKAAHDIMRLHYEK